MNSSTPSPSNASTALFDDPDPMASFAAPPFDPANIFNVNGLVVVITGGATECDVTSRESLLTVADSVRSRHGYIDLLINNAGIARNLYAHPLPSPSPPHLSSYTGPPSPPASPALGPTIPSIKAFQSALWDTGSPEDFAETFATNVTAVYYTTVAFLDLLYQGNVRQQRLAGQSGPGIPRPPYHSSQVLSVSSSGSFRLDPKILSPSYTLSKSACTHLGKLLANLLAPWGIRSNILAPGVWPSGGFYSDQCLSYTLTERLLWFEEMTTNPIPDFKLDPIALADSIPLRRTGTEEVGLVRGHVVLPADLSGKDMAGAILFLASRAGAYVNGAVWLVDGGRIGSVASSY
ncbi:hypothetical protein C0991_005079 [Blastosporella zonata]|nr:hypothetical protein C0991_005079 [Blastosporella zonata]